MKYFIELKINTAKYGGQQYENATVSCESDDEKTTKESVMKEVVEMRDIIIKFYQNSAKNTFEDDPTKPEFIEKQGMIFQQGGEDYEKELKKRKKL